MSKDESSIERERRLREEWFKKHPKLRKELRFEKRWARRRTEAKLPPKYTSYIPKVDMPQIGFGMPAPITRVEAVPIIIEEEADTEFGVTPAIVETKPVRGRVGLWSYDRVGDEIIVKRKVTRSLVEPGTKREISTFEDVETRSKDFSGTVQCMEVRSATQKEDCEKVKLAFACAATLRDVPEGIRGLPDVVPVMTRTMADLIADVPKGTTSQCQRTDPSFARAVTDTVGTKRIPWPEDSHEKLLAVKVKEAEKILREG